MKNLIHLINALEKDKTFSPFREPVIQTETSWSQGEEVNGFSLLILEEAYGGPSFKVMVAEA